MTVPNINDPRRFEIEWRCDNKGMTLDEYMDMRADHVNSDRAQARKIWYHPNFDWRSATLEDVTRQVRIENDQGRQIKGEIAYVDDWYLCDRRALGL